MERELLPSEQIVEYRPATSVCFLQNGQLVSLPFETIVRARSWTAGSIIFTATQSYRCYLTMEELERTLPLNEFFSVNATHILAIGRITGWKDNVALIGNRNFKLSKFKRTELNMKLGQLLNSQYDRIYEKGI